MPIPTLAEKLAWLKPAPTTQHEKACAAKIPQGDYEIGVQITNDILDEAMEVFIRSSRSYFGVSGDSMVALFTAGGDLINASCGTYLHAIIQPIVIKFILKYYEKNPGIRDGDIWYTNDALYGGIHNPDQVALMPIFYKGQLLAWGSAALHTTETGAIEPGGMPVSAKSRFEEGLNLPPIKIGENFEIRQDFLEFYTVYGLRAPAMFISDLRARCTTADRVRVRVLELAEKRGPDFVVGLMRKMCETAEAGARKKIKSLPDGKFRAVVFNDAIGWTPALVRACNLTVTKKDGNIVFDFAGTSPENPSSYNVHPQAVVGHIANFMYEYIFHDLPIASSTFAAIDFEFPRRHHPQSRQNGRHQLLRLHRHAVPLRHAQRFRENDVFQRRPLETGRRRSRQPAHLANLRRTLAMESRRVRRSFVFAQYAGPGRPLRPGRHGRVRFRLVCLRPRARFRASRKRTPRHRHALAALERFQRPRTPSRRLWRRAALDDSQSSRTRFHVHGQRQQSSPRPAAFRRLRVFAYSRNQYSQSGFAETNGRRQPRAYHGFPHHPRRSHHPGKLEYGIDRTHSRKFTTKAICFSASAAEAPVTATRSSATPLEILEDVKKKIISDATAQNIYRIAYDPVRRKLDPEKTKQLRDEERRARLARGKSFDEFQQNWSKLSPPKEILQWYGTWPDAKSTGPCFRP